MGTKAWRDVSEEDIAKKFALTQVRNLEPYGNFKRHPAGSRNAYNGAQSFPLTKISTLTDSMVL